jgi:uncharacterized protein YdbL (DUF1318 family)
MRRSLTFKLGLLTLLLATACVTINVYFPAAEAQKAADQIIDGVLGSDAKPDKSTATPAPQSSLYQHGQAVWMAVAGQLLEWVIPSANAQAADLNVNTPAIRQITQSMEARHGSLKPYYDSGAVGFTKDGLVDIRDQNAIPLAERNAVKKLVSDESADRNTLYRELAKSNNHPEWEADIRKTFAQRWIDKAAAGWYYQDAGGSWKQK